MLLGGLSSFPAASCRISLSNEHLTLKTETTRPPGINSLQQQARFDAFLQEFNNERPHEALDMKCPAEIHTASPHHERRTCHSGEYVAGAWRHGKRKSRACEGSGFRGRGGLVLKWLLPAPNTTVPVPESVPPLNVLIGPSNSSVPVESETVPAPE
jgi:hypothetical protein